MARNTGIDVLDPFRTWLIENPDFSPSDELRAIAALAQREELIESYLREEGSLDDVLDCLSDQGIDPDGWVNQVSRNIEVVLDGGIHFTSNENGLFLPTRF